MRKLLFILPIILLCFSSCNRLQEAQKVVAECDSLLNAGLLYEDSASLAGAVGTLNHYRLLYPTEYAKANYYYGRLLRSRENYVAAMQCFIDATETHTNDYNVLGRSYSNIATICSYEENFKLAYDLYEKSSQCFNKAKQVCIIMH